MTSPGEIVNGRYESRKVVATHGCARVFEAHDRVRGRAVRVKYIDLPGERSRALLKRESQLLAMLEEQTSGTLAFQDLVEHEGVLYQVTEHVRGVWLRHWQEQNPSPRQFPALEPGALTTDVVGAVPLVPGALTPELRALLRSVLGEKILGTVAV